MIQAGSGDTEGRVIQAGSGDTEEQLATPEQQVASEPSWACCLDPLILDSDLAG